MNRLRAHVAVLERWRRKMNLVAAKSFEGVWRRHVLDSAQLAALIPPGAENIVDMGSGAGFPGLVLAAVIPARVTLIESNARKCAFLRQAAREMEVEAEIIHGRIEDIAESRVCEADIVTARALAPLDRLLALAGPLLRGSGKGPGFCLFAKGKTRQEELTIAEKHWKLSVTPTPSLSDPAGAILKVENFERR
ncbi:MAG TPA: 16S rRNA (guanine(527)-N(7))-methyltransferase RsmG [Alphaproteobacteria bacterium]|nr:16S rRNA (guanine(527)-N(7))-methyltransferase RsmG [Alphaproteobacteria bacterium]